MRKMLRRHRRRINSSSDCKFFKKENGQEHCFFGDQEHDEFFQGNKAVHRKCAECEKEEKAQRATDKKEDDKQRHRAPDKKEDDKQMHRATDKKEDDKQMHRAPDKKEDDKRLHRSHDEKEEDKSVHRKEGSGGTNTSGTSYINSLGSKGSPLSKSTQQFFQSKMGYDFSNVRIHNSHEASESARSINAKAYTVDNHIVFKEGQYNPDTHEGQKLLAHELTHVIQEPDNAMRQVDAPDEMEVMAPMVTTGRGSSTSNQRNFGTSVNVQGHTDANYDHGNFSTANMHTTRATGCGDCGDRPCVTATGILVSVFQVSPSVTLPSVPSNLTPCQQQRVQDFITNVLSPHEQQHVNAFNTYNGTVRTPFTFTGCQTEDALNAFVQPIHDAIDLRRTTAANALSNALDPFNGTIDINCQEPTTDAGAGNQ
ncbi:MAG TPA: DUF4157 domain-containing protein [Flavipsychrobacter sp.]|nr:DUF4157 domain-containing protein [Flavipsychrobacter sp.]